MGQQESKQEADKIIKSLEKIRNDIRNGQITANNAEKLQQYLKRYSEQLNGDQSVRVGRRYSVQDLIDITSQELDALKQEVNLDQGTVPSNSFRRSSSRKSKSKRKSIKSINEAVKNIRVQIRTKQLQNEDYERLQSELIHYSQLLSGKKSNKTENDAAQKLIVSVTEELQRKRLNASDSREPDASDSASKSENERLKRQSNSSLKRSSLSEKRLSWKPQKEQPKITSQSTSNLVDIENKLKALKTDMTVAENNKDKSRLHFLSKSVQILMRDLQMVDVDNQPVNGEKKQLLEKSLQRTYHQIDKIKRQITEESDLKYLTELQNKEKREKIFQDLDECYNNFISIGKNINGQNLQAQKESFLTYKQKLESIEDLDDEVISSKTDIADVVLSVEKAFTKFEMEERLNQAEWRHFQYKIDLKQFTGGTESETYKKHRQYLTQLRDYVNKIEEVNYKVDEKKKYVLYNIDNNITALDHKAHENTKPKEATKKNPTLHDIGKELVDASQKLPETPKELSNILPFIVQAKRIIEHKLQLLPTEEKETVSPARHNQEQPKGKSSVSTEDNSAKVSQNVKKEHIQKQSSPIRTQSNIKDLQVIEPTYDSITPLQPQKAFIKDDSEPVRSPVPAARAQIKNVPTKNDQTHFDNKKTQMTTHFQETRATSTQFDNEETRFDNKHLQPELRHEHRRLYSTPPDQTEKTPEPSSKPSVRSQLDNIKNEVGMLQIHIQSARFSKDTQIYKDIKNRLESYKKQIAKLCHENPDSDNLVNNIDNLLVLLDNNTSNRKSTTEDILSDIMSVSTRVDDLGIKIQNFSHTLQDYDSIKGSLEEHKDYLNNLKVASNRKNVQKCRYDLLDRIDQLLLNLEQAVRSDQSLTSEEEKQFNQDLRKVKDKVNRYSGTYKNVLYKAIENDLDKQLNKADKVFKDANVASKVKEDIQNTKMILEQKSTKEQQLKRDIRESGGKELSEIRENVESVKTTLTTSAPLSKEELDKLDARLTLSILALDNIRDEHLSEEKEKLYKEIHLYFQTIQELIVMTTTNPILAEQELIEEKPTIGMTMAKIERELAEVKPQILSFVGTETSHNFLILDEILVRGTLKLDDLQIDPNSEWYQLKLKLMADIHKYCDILDERINQTEEVQLLEKKVKVMLMRIDSFNGHLNDPDYMKLDEEIIGLKISLGKLQVNPELFPKKQACVREVDACMRKLKEVAKPQKESFAGTLV